MKIKWEDIKPGDIVELIYTGNTRVPKFLNGVSATALERNQAGNLIVQSHHKSDNITRTVQECDVNVEKTIQNNILLNSTN